MSLFVDLKYLKLISSQLPLFKQKNTNLYNCRCIICGDSSAKKNKARGYFYAVKNDLFYKCHNCNASMHFGSFLKQINGLQYSQYTLERYNEGLPNNKPHQKIEDKFKMEEPVFNKKEERLLDKILDRLDTLPEDNEAVKFCVNRKIPLDKFHNLYFIKSIKDIVQLNNKYKDNIKTEEPRLVLPFYNANDELIAVTCRALRNESLRYVTVKIKEDELLAFGLDKLDKEKTIFVVEGPIDSLFLPNCIAVAGTAFTKLDTLNLPKDKVVAILDNQPRNKDVCKILNKMIDSQYKVVIWPQSLEQKDINEMILAGKNPADIIKKHTFQGLEAKIKFTEWKRC
jgi:hypothetical protein